MTNPWRGEVSLVLNGTPQVMRLTLGALAELEAQLGEDSLVALVTRFEEAAFSARDVITLLCAGLRGGGWQGNAEDLAHANIEGGAIAASRAAAKLILRAFQMPPASHDA